jgi:hypothetical protein
VLSRTDVHRYTRKLYKFMREGHRIEFKKHRGYRGMIWDSPEGDCNGVVLVTLDHRENVISTLIHEVLHHIHPDWSETDILNMESQLINALTQRQIRTIIKRFAEVL